MVKRVRAKKNFVVIVYDIADDKRRNRVVKILEEIGTRVNYSVFECCLSDSVLEKTKKSIAKHIDTHTDSVVYYPICVNCFCKIEYQPECRRPHKVVDIV